MLDEVDTALRALLRAAVPAGASVDLRIPERSWLTGPRAEPIVSMVLCDVREDIGSRVAGPVEVRDERGRLLGRRQAPRQYRIWYLVTAWGTDVATEHRLLGGLLRALSGLDQIPAEQLTGSLAEAGLPVLLSLGHPDLPLADRDRWSDRAGLELVVTAPVLPALGTDLAAPAETIDLAVGRLDPVPAGRASTAGKSWRDSRIRERR